MQGEPKAVLASGRHTAIFQLSLIDERRLGDSAVRIFFLTLFSLVVGERCSSESSPDSRQRDQRSYCCDKCCSCLLSCHCFLPVLKAPRTTSRIGNTKPPRLPGRGKVKLTQDRQKAPSSIKIQLSRTASLFITGCREVLFSP